MTERSNQAPEYGITTLGTYLTDHSEQNCLTQKTALSSTYTSQVSTVIACLIHPNSGPFPLCVSQSTAVNNRTPQHHAVLDTRAVARVAILFLGQLPLSLPSPPWISHGISAAGYPILLSTLSLGSQWLWPKTPLTRYRPVCVTRPHTVTPVRTWLTVHGTTTCDAQQTGQRGVVMAWDEPRRLLSHRRVSVHTYTGLTSTLSQRKKDFYPYLRPIPRSVPQAPVDMWEGGGGGGTGYAAPDLSALGSSARERHLRRYSIGETRHAYGLALRPQHDKTYKLHGLDHDQLGTNHGLSQCTNRGWERWKRGGGGP
ncbi:uncharacterized protein B0T15DRAFT_96942 [Chaetomium strumarium]|uniref:Uncharacterized protein n=1 Tax=Chaetomium strumarium TaxID=1170767 RepID=A0AAJ0M3W2_9PEZI|nr:hypothetical protein B0T15DRAFT_96942 [Chaetomium strumarium]